MKELIEKLNITNKELSIYNSLRREMGVPQGEILPEEALDIFNDFFIMKGYIPADDSGIWFRGRDAERIKDMFNLQSEHVPFARNKPYEPSIPGYETYELWDLPSKSQGDIIGYYFYDAAPDYGLLNIGVSNFMAMFLAVAVEEHGQEVVTPYMSSISSLNRFELFKEEYKKYKNKKIEDFVLKFLRRR